MRPLFFEKNSTFWYEALRTLSHTSYGGADLTEVLVAVEKITEGDFDSWHTHWNELAERVRAEGRRAADAGRPVSARDAFLRASNYFRTAEFFLHGDPSDPRIEACYRESTDCYRAAIARWHHPIQSVEIPYESTTLPGYFHTAHATAGRRPLVVMHSGFDGSAEELHFDGAAALAERGYHVLTFDGPGQSGPLHREGLVFRPDWEQVVAPVLDFACAREDVDTSRIALVGMSMGGMLAPRAAAFEPRLAAMAAVDGVYDMGAIPTRQLGLPREQAKALAQAESAPEVDAALAESMETDPSNAWALRHGMWATGSETPREYIASMFDYWLGDGVAERITCPTLVCSAPNDFVMAGQPEELYAHLTCEKTFIEFGAEWGADEHCQVGARRLLAARLGDWLDETLSRENAK